VTSTPDNPLRRFTVNFPAGLNQLPEEQYLAEMRRLVAPCAAAFLEALNALPDLPARRAAVSGWLESIEGELVASQLRDDWLLELEQALMVLDSGLEGAELEQSDKAAP
jgi:hypothetical protein